MKDQWVPQATRDAVVDYLAHWTKRTELPAKTLLSWLELAPSKFHQWKARYGRPNAHNARAPRDGWLDAWEQQAILDFHERHPLEGYRRLTFMSNRLQIGIVGDRGSLGRWDLILRGLGYCDASTTGV